MAACSLHTGKTIEIIGCAGSGKSSVAQRLSEDGCVLTSIPPAEYKRQCLKCVILKLPVLLLLCLLRVRRHYLKTLIRVEAALTTVQLGKKRHLILNKTFIFDQGPISKLAYLHLKGIPNKIVELWLKALQKKSIQTFDLLIWLNAANDLLRFRVNNRAEHHKIKNKPKELVDGFYDAYRACFKTVIGNSIENIPCEYIETGTMSVEEVTEKIRKLL